MNTRKNTSKKRVTARHSPPKANPFDEISDSRLMAALARLKPEKYKTAREETLQFLEEQKRLRRERPTRRPSN
jgi:hypothetical protein